MSNESKKNLSEALKRYNLLSEYNFYIPRKDEDNMYKGEEETLDEQEVEPAVEPTSETEPTSDVTPSTDIVTPTEPTENLPTPEIETTPTPVEPTTPESGEVEVDVTDIVKDTKETKEAVNSGNQKVDELLNKLTDLETKLSAMNDLVNKIEELEGEIEKRNPTPEEKLEMRSFDSYPYNLKLTDYWAEKEGAYNVLNNNKKVVPTEEKEYVLTQGDVEKDYNEGEVSDSFYPEQ
jgi:hypothetical protein